MECTSTFTVRYHRSDYGYFCPLISGLGLAGQVKQRLPALGIVNIQMNATTMRKLPLIALLSMMCFSVLAQDAAVGPKQRRKFRLGLNIAPAVDFFTTNTTGVEADAVRFKFGAGVMGEYAITNNYAFAFGLEWKGAGAALAYENAYYMSQQDMTKGETFRLMSRNYRNDYINIPVTMKLMTNEIGYFTYFAQVGADLSVLVSSKALDNGAFLSLDTLGSVILTDQEIDYRDVYSQTSFANVRLRVGVGAEWNFSGNTSLVFSLTYHHGFIDVLRDADEEDVVDAEGVFFSPNSVDAFDASKRTPYSMAANLHYVALNIGILF